jgi:hypothetical protein
MHCLFSLNSNCAAAVTAHYSVALSVTRRPCRAAVKSSGPLALWLPFSVNYVVLCRVVEQSFVTFHHANSIAFQLLRISSIIAFCVYVPENLISSIFIETNINDIPALKTKLQQFVPDIRSCKQARSCRPAAKRNKKLLSVLRVCRVLFKRNMMRVQTAVISCPLVK